MKYEDGWQPIATRPRDRDVLLGKYNEFSRILSATSRDYWPITSYTWTHWREMPKGPPGPKEDWEEAWDSLPSWKHNEECIIIESMVYTQEEFKVLFNFTKQYLKDEKKRARDNT